MIFFRVEIFQFADQVLRTWLLVLSLFQPATQLLYLGLQSILLFDELSFVILPTLCHFRTILFGVLQNLSPLTPLLRELVSQFPYLLLQKIRLLLFKPSHFWLGHKHICLMVLHILSYHCFQSSYLFCLLFLALTCPLLLSSPVLTYSFDLLHFALEQQCKPIQFLCILLAHYNLSLLKLFDFKLSRRVNLTFGIC